MATNATWERSTWTDAGQLCAYVDDDDAPDNANGKALHEWYGWLSETGQLANAVRFMAHALPRYDCVVWAAQSLVELGIVDRQDPMMVAVLRWIDNPEDEMRRAAYALAEMNRKDTPAKLMCMAVFLSGGSIAPEDLPAIQPPADGCAKLVSGALIVGCYSRPNPLDCFSKLLDTGEKMVTTT